MDSRSLSGTGQPLTWGGVFIGAPENNPESISSDLGILSEQRAMGHWPRWYV